MAAHHFSLGALTPQNNLPGGNRREAKKSNFPALRDMSIALLELVPKGVREPHWHPNANELSYCIEGQGLMTVFSPGAGHDTFTITAGEIIFVPAGYIHHIENTGTTPLKLVICFNHEEAEDISFSSGVSAMPNHILAATLEISSDLFSKLHKNIKGDFITIKETATIPPLPMMTDKFKYNVEAENPQVQNSGGWVKMSNTFLFPALEGLAMYAVLLKAKGAREPHWHPNAAELNYLISGKARITLLSPGGVVETFDLNPGDISYLPKGYLHHIENTGEEDAHFAIFFNNKAPSDIGFSGCFGAYANDVLASLFGVSVQEFKDIPKFQQDLLVISGGG